MNNIERFAAAPAFQFGCDDLGPSGAAGRSGQQGDGPAGAALQYCTTEIVATAVDVEECFPDKLAAKLVQDGMPTV
jgi:hypothetical protein